MGKRGNESGRTWFSQRLKEVDQENEGDGSFTAAETDATVEVPHTAKDYTHILFEAFSIDSISQCSVDKYNIDGYNAEIKKTQKNYSGLSAEYPSILEQESKESSNDTTHGSSVNSLISSATSLEQYWLDAILEPQIVSRDNSIYNYSTESYEEASNIKVQSFASDIYLPPSQSQDKTSQSHDDESRRELRDEIDSSSQSLISAEASPSRDTPVSTEKVTLTKNSRAESILESVSVGVSLSQDHSEKLADGENESTSSSLGAQKDASPPLIESLLTSVSKDNKTNIDHTSIRSKFSVIGKWFPFMKGRHPTQEPSPSNDGMCLAASASNDDRTNTDNSSIKRKLSVTGKWHPFKKGHYPNQEHLPSNHRERLVTSVSNDDRINSDDGSTKSNLTVTGKWHPFKKGRHPTQEQSPKYDGESLEVPASNDDRTITDNGSTISKLSVTGKWHPFKKGRHPTQEQSPRDDGESLDVSAFNDHGTTTDNGSTKSKSTVTGKWHPFKKDLHPPQEQSPSNDGENLGVSASNDDRTNTDNGSTKSKLSVTGKWQSFKKGRRPTQEQSPTNDGDESTSSFFGAVPSRLSDSPSDLASNKEKSTTDDGFVKSKLGSIRKWRRFKVINKSEAPEDKLSDIDKGVILPTPSLLDVEIVSTASIQTSDQTSETEVIHNADESVELKLVLSAAKAQKHQEGATHCGEGSVPSVVGNGVASNNTNMSEEEVSCLTPCSASVSSVSSGSSLRPQKFLFWKRKKSEALALTKVDEEASFFSCTVSTDIVLFARYANCFININASLLCRIIFRPAPQKMSSLQFITKKLLKRKARTAGERDLGSGGSEKSRYF